MAKSPHTPEFRAKVSREYLDGSSYPFLAEKYNLGETTLQQWFTKYRLYGIAAFIKTAGNSSYSSDFKKMCVEAVLSGQGSVDDVVAIYNSSSREVLRNWIMCYNNIIKVTVTLKMKQETFTDINYSFRKKKTKRKEFLEIMGEIILECYTISRGDKDPKIWYNSGSMSIK